MAKLNVTNIETDSIKNELSTNGGITISSTGQVSIPDLATPTTASEPATKSYVDTEIAGAGVPDGDKGDITVSNSGATWTLDNTSVTAGSYSLTNLTVDAQGRITSASNGSASVPSTAGAVGTYGLFYQASGGIINPGGTRAGSGLDWASSNGIGGVSRPSGTWRSMGWSAGTCSSQKAGCITVWIRIS